MSLLATANSRFAALLRPLTGVSLAPGVTPIALAITVGIVAGFEDLFFNHLGPAITDAAGGWAILLVSVIVVVPITWLITSFAPETRGPIVLEADEQLTILAETAAEAAVRRLLSEVVQTSQIPGDD